MDLSKNSSCLRRILVILACLSAFSHSKSLIARYWQPKQPLEHPNCVDEGYQTHTRFAESGSIVWSLEMLVVHSECAQYTEHVVRSRRSSKRIQVWACQQCKSTFFEARVIPKKVRPRKNARYASGKHGNHSIKKPIGKRKKGTVQWYIFFLWACFESIINP